MAQSRKYFNLRANSILESVVALSIISICLYIAVLVYTSVFSARTSPKFYTTRHKISELYYEIQLNPDSINSLNGDDFRIDSEWINAGLQHIDVEYKDSSGVVIKNQFYIQHEK